MWAVCSRRPQFVLHGCEGMVGILVRTSQGDSLVAKSVIGGQSGCLVMLIGYGLGDCAHKLAQVASGRLEKACQHARGSGMERHLPS